MKAQYKHLQPMSIHSCIMFIGSRVRCVSDITGALKTLPVVHLAYILSSSLNYMLWP